MTDNITSISGAISKKRNQEADNAAADMLNHAMSADTMPYQTKQLVRLLKMTSYTSISRYGPSVDVDNSQLVSAASTQSYQFEYDLDKNAFAFHFDGEYHYQVKMDTTYTSEQAMVDIKNLESEARNNDFISLINQKRLFPMSGGEPKYDPKVFLPTPLSTSALSMILKFTNNITKPTLDDLGRVAFIDLNKTEAISNLLVKAQHTLFNIVPYENSGAITIFMSDTENTTFGVDMNDSVDADHMKLIAELLAQEISQNHKTYRDNDPAVEDRKLQMQEANAFLQSSLDDDPTLNDYMKELLEDDVEYQRSNGNDTKAGELIAIENANNVTSMPRRK